MTVTIEIIICTAPNCPWFIVDLLGLMPWIPWNSVQKPYQKHCQCSYQHWKYFQKGLWKEASGRRGNLENEKWKSFNGRKCSLKRTEENARRYYTDHLIEKVVFWTTFSQQQTGSNLRNTIFLWALLDQGHAIIVTFKFLYQRLWHTWDESHTWSNHTKAIISHIVLSKSEPPDRGM